MPKGGARPGAGRPKGKKNKTTIEREQALAQMAVKLEEAIPNTFKGKAHELLMAVYKNEDLPLPIRIDAAKAAIGFEIPRLGNTNMTLDDKRTAEQFSDAELEAIAIAGRNGTVEAEEGEAGSDQLH
jgi:hypothetical protein